MSQNKHLFFMLAPFKGASLGVGLYIYTLSCLTPNYRVTETCKKSARSFSGYELFVSISYKLPSTSISVQAPKNTFLVSFSFFSSVFCFFAKKHEKALINQIWSAQHPNAAHNIQQLWTTDMKISTCLKNWDTLLKWKQN